MSSGAAATRVPTNFARRSIERRASPSRTSSKRLRTSFALRGRAGLRVADDLGDAALGASSGSRTQSHQCISLDSATAVVAPHVHHQSWKPWCRAARRRPKSGIITQPPLSQMFEDPIHGPRLAGLRPLEGAFSAATPFTKATESCSSKPSLRFAMRESAPCRISVGIATQRPSAVVTSASEMPDERLLRVAGTEDRDQLEGLDHADHGTEQAEQRRCGGRDREEGQEALERRAHPQDLLEEDLLEQRRASRWACSTPDGRASRRRRPSMASARLLAPRPSSCRRELVEDAVDLRSATRRKPRISTGLEERREHERASRGR